jgi:hypothetical protein
MAPLWRIPVVSLACLLAGIVLAQTPLVSMRGTLRVLDKKQIIIDAGDEQIVTFRRVKKTRFLKGSKEIPETELHPGASVVIEASRERDGEFDAVNVFLGEPPASLR